jgi:hypothetical protein
VSHEIFAEERDPHLADLVSRLAGASTSTGAAPL